MGTLALLQQYHQQKYGRFMRAASLKGLACHTADDAGLPGPDPVFGWGLLNAKAAANLITTDGLESWISEEILRQGETFTMTVNTLPNQPLMATICWTDVPGVANNGVINDLTPALINDLDIRITKNDMVFYPWRLRENPTLPAVRNGDNFVDNVENILIDSSQGGSYTITVTHKGTLVDLEQRFSLIVSGLNNSFAVTSMGEVDKTVCSSENAVFDFNFTQTGSTPVNMSALNLPDGATASFSSPTLTSSGNFQMTISNLNNVPGGIYFLQLEASNGVETISRTLVLRVFQEDISPVTVISPTPYQTGLGSAVTLEWEVDNNYEYFFVEVATDVNFNSVIFSQNISQNQITVNNLNDQTVYYWRVMPTNRCSILSEMTVYSFQTGVFNCQLFYESSDYSNAVIEEVAGATALVPVTVTDNFIVGKVNVIVNLTHTWVQDVTLYLQRDDLILGFITLVDQPCGSQDDIVATFNDFGVPLQCENQPAISGNVIPLESLSHFNLQNAQGVWSLFVTDSYFEDDGQVNYFGLEFCSTSAVDNLPMFNAETIFTETNSNKTITIQEMNANTQLQSSLEQTYTLVSVPALGVLQKNGIALGLGGQFSQQDIEQQLITYSNSLTGPAQDQFVVDIVNSSNGWLPQQTVDVVIQNNLSQPGFEKPSWMLSPNPSRGTLTIGGDFNEVQLQVYDLQGRLVFKTTAEKNKTVFLNGLQEGVYLIQIAEGNKVQMEKIVFKK
jgi:subtilisin-like proprotein convertase family protein